MVPKYETVQVNKKKVQEALLNKNFQTIIAYLVFMAAKEANEGVVSLLAKSLLKYLSFCFEISTPK